MGSLDAKRRIIDNYTNGPASPRGGLFYVPVGRFSSRCRPCRS